MTNYTRRALGNLSSDAGSTPAISTKHKSDEHLLLLHRRICREGGHLTKQKKPRLEMTLVFLLYRGIEIINCYVI